MSALYIVIQNRIFSAFTRNPMFLSEIVRTRLLKHDINYHQFFFIVSIHLFWLRIKPIIDTDNCNIYTNTTSKDNESNEDNRGYKWLIAGEYGLLMSYCASTRLSLAINYKLMVEELISNVTSFVASNVIPCTFVILYLYG